MHAVAAFSASIITFVSGFFAPTVASNSPVNVQTTQPAAAAAAQTEIAGNPSNDSAAASTVVAASAVAPAPAAPPPQPQTIINQPVIERIIERIVPQGAANVSTETLAAILSDFEQSINNRIAAINPPKATIPVQVAAAGNVTGTFFPASQRIDQLTNTAINTPTITGGTISGASVSGYLPLSGGALTGALTGTDLSLSGTLNVAGVSSGGAIFAPYFSATSTTATSTFAGGLTTANGAFTVLQNGNVGIGTTNPNGQLNLEGFTVNSSSPLSQLNVSGTVDTSQTSGTGSVFGSTLAWNTVGSNTAGPAGLRINLNSGYTGSGYNRALVINNNAAGSGWWSPYDQNHGNFGAVINSQSGGSTGAVGDNVGIYAVGDHSQGLNIGIFGRSTVNGGPASIAHVGVIGYASSWTAGAGSESGSEIGGYFAISNSGSTWQTAYLTNTYAALVAENGQTGKSIFIGRANNVDVFTIDGTGNVGIGTTTPWGKLAINLNSGETNANAFVIASSTASATTTLLIVTNTGNVGIGTTSPTAQLHTTGTVRFSNFGAGTLTTDASGNLSVSSDERLKTIDDAFSRGLADVLQLSPIQYHWNPLSGLDTSTQYAGFSAQNVQAAIPEAVGSSTNGYLTLQDRPLIAALVNAIKQLAQQFGGFAERITTKELIATNGSFHQVNADMLCIGSTCLTEGQVKAILAATGQSAVFPSPTLPSTTNTPQAPVVEINGNATSTIEIGTIYLDLGARIVAPEEDLNLGIVMLLDGATSTAVSIDTTVPGEHTIVYTVTNPTGLTGRATRRVIVSPAEQPPLPPANDNASSTPAAASI